MLSQYVGSSIMHAKWLHATLRTHATRRSTQFLSESRVYLCARGDATTTRPPPTETRTVIPRLHAISSPAPSPLLKYLTKHFSGKLPLSLSLSLSPRKSRTERRFLFTGEARSLEKCPLISPLLVRVQLLSFSFLFFFQREEHFLSTRHLFRVHKGLFIVSRTLFSQVILRSMSEELMTSQWRTIKR